MSELPKTYNKSREDEIYARWLEKGYFKASPNQAKKPYTIMMPPPNITSQLHLGHALNNTIPDILIRFKRMQGFEALYLPGTDHAAIATEIVVVNALAKEGITKESLGREAFLEKMWSWYDKYGSTIVGQLKKLGISADWDKLRFTMDEGLSKAVLETFVRMYNCGKIYKGERLVNWCTKCQTSISDAEVEHEDRESTLYHFKYPVEGGGEIAFATTRPETMLGDTAVAVNPKDERYTAYIGKMVTVPTVSKEGRKIPIVADDYVDPKFGTGVVKITPGHDPNDFEVAERQNLPRINILNDDGTINENGGENYRGLTREEARIKITEEMKQLGLFIKTEILNNSVGEHDRCGTVIEPILKEQWFVSMEELAKPALEAYTSGRLKFNRDQYGKVYKHWLDNIKDWCISRQLWWGHRIPAYYCPCGHVVVSVDVPVKCPVCGGEDLTQDEDVLDTWFSSALWPFSTLGWPEKTPELEYFYPGNTLVTAREIIFTWVIRMMFSGIEFMGDMPFTDVFINGIVRDDQGRKMSKSLGNGIDPLEIIEEYGADALRLMLISGNAVDSDTRFHSERLDPARNFLNKMWNATRFILMTSEDCDVFTADLQIGDLQTEDLWILSLLNRLVAETTERLEAHELGMAVQKIVDFAWDEFCDWYVEMVKPRLYSKDEADARSRSGAQHTLRHVLLTVIKLLHPVTPFITEDLFAALQTEKESIMLAEWPLENPAQNQPAAEKDIERIKDAVRAIRAVRTEKQVPPAKKITIIVQPTDGATAKLYAASKTFLGFLSGASDVEIVAGGDGPPAGAISVVVSGAAIYLPLDSLVDAEKEKARLSKEIDRLEKEIARVDGKLANPGFTAKAPQSLVAAEQEKREEFVAMLAKVREELAAGSK